MKKSLRVIAPICALLLTACPDVYGYELSDQEALQFLKNDERNRLRLSAGRRGSSGASGRFTVTDRTRSAKGAGVILTLKDENDGAVFIMGGDSEFHEIIGVIPGGLKEDGSLPPAFRQWTELMIADLDLYLGQTGNQSSNGGSKNSVAKVSGVSFLAPKSEIAPLVRTTWGQGAPYNDLLEDNLTGCVATAMAQVMNYYSYPDRGRGSVEYEYEGNVYAMDFSSVSFQWDQMRDDYSTGGDGRAVAELMKACGHAVKMMYGMNASGAYMVDLVPAMTRNFNYSSRASLIDRSGIPTNVWEDMVYDQISQGMPLLMAGRTDPSCYSDGHAFICDGYSDSGLFHFNWGWNGDYDGWFSLGIGEGMYTYSQNAAFNLVPLTHPATQMSPLPLLTRFHIRNESDNTINMSARLENHEREAISVLPVLLFTDTQSGQQQKVAISESLVNINPIDSENGSEDNGYELETRWDINIEDGVYDVSVGTIIDGKVIKPVAKGYGANAYTMEIKDNRIVSFTENQVESLAVTAVDFIATPIAGSAGEFVITVLNDGLTDTSAWIYVEVYGEGECLHSQLYNGGYMSPDESTGIDVSLPELSAGEYELRIFNPDGRMKEYKMTFTVYSDDEILSVDGLEGVIKDDSTMQIIGYEAVGTRAGAQVRIPNTVIVNGEEYPVSGIDSRIFKDRKVTDFVIEAEVYKDLTVLDHLTGTRLTNLELPASLKSLGTKCLNRNDYLETCILPEGLEKLGDDVFEGCNSLTELTVLAPVPPFEISTGAFSQSQKTMVVLKVPSASVELYKTANVWREFKKIRPIIDSGVEELVTPDFEIVNIQGGLELKHTGDRDWSVSDVSGKLLAKGRGDSRITGIEGICIVQIGSESRVMLIRF